MCIETGHTIENYSRVGSYFFIQSCCLPPQKYYSVECVIGKGGGPELGPF